MTTLKELEKLLLEIIHLMSQKYANNAILKGGMQLRLMNSPRHTNDVDYVFPEKTSRKTLLKELKTLFTKNNITIINESLNSRGLVLSVEKNKIRAAIEISIVNHLNCAPEQITTDSLANQFYIPAHIVTVMNLKEAFSHKIAASLERNLIRDLYDITIFEPLTTFDSETLKTRLKKLTILRKKPISISFAEAAKLLKKRTEKLTQRDIVEELAGVVPETFLQANGEKIIKSTVFKLCQQLEHTNL